MFAKTCAKCGNPLQLVANDTMAKCPHCKAMYFANDEDNIQDKFVRETLLECESLLFEKQWDAARECYMNLTKTHPLEIDAWMGLARTLTREQTFFALSGEEYKILNMALGKVQALQGALIDDSWRAYRTKYEQYRDTQRMELQDQCEKLAHWVDNKQDGDTKMAAKLMFFSAGFLIITLGIVMCIVDTRLWFLIPITGSIAAILGLVMRGYSAKADITSEEKERVRKRCAELQKQAKYWNVEIFFRQDIRNLLNEKK